MVDSEAVDAGTAARVAISVSDALYDGFWVFNNHEGLQQALRLGALIDHFPRRRSCWTGFGSVTFANDALRNALRADMGELEGCKLDDLVVGEGSVLTDLESNVTVTIAVETRYYRQCVSEVVTSEGTEYFGQLIDRTDEVRLERTKEQVIATISHELRTPLTAVVGYAGLLNEAERGELTGVEVDQGEALAVIYEQASHLLDLVTDLVDFARLRHRSRRPQTG